MTSSFLIGPTKEGLRRDVKPFAIPEDAYQNMTNAYTYRGRVKRRQGYSLLGRLQQIISVQIAGASAQHFTANLFSVFSITNPLANVVPRSITIDVNSGLYILTEDPLNPGSIIQTGGLGTDYANGTINYLTSVLALNWTSGSPGGNVVITFSYALNQPVTGLRTRELFGVNQQDLIGFDTTLAYRYSNTLKQFILMPSVIPTVWTGADWNLFYTENYSGAFWATNFIPGLHGVKISAIAIGAITTITTSTAHGYTTGQSVSFIHISGTTELNGITSVITVISPTQFTIVFLTTHPYVSGGMVLNPQVMVTGQDGIRFYGNVTNIGNSWVNYNPPINADNALAGALGIVPYRGYLVFLNTWEGNEDGVFNYGNRARWTQIGTPFNILPVPTTPSPQTADEKAARDDIIGRGGANDAPTQEVIVSWGFIRDILVVMLERSAWRLRFVNNSQNPFVWERCNTELGSSCTFSSVIFNNGLMTLGDRGAVISDGNDAQRFDEKIPDDVFNISANNNGFERVYGIRSFRTKLVYWAFSADENPYAIFPNTVFVYNYDMKTWSFFDDCFTCFGYQYPFDDVTWGDLTKPWSSYTDVYWNGGNASEEYENLVAGNQQGFVSILESGIQNDPSLNITAISGSTFTSVNNNLANGDWIKLSGISGVLDTNGIFLNGRNFKVIDPDYSANTFTIKEFKTVNAGSASGTTFTYDLETSYTPIYPGSVFIYVGTLIFTDIDLDGILVDSDETSTGVINYSTGKFTLNFSPSISSTTVYIRVTANQGLETISTTGTYTGGGYISKISGFEVLSKIFNFFKQGQRTRLHQIDFYTSSTEAGEFTCNVYGDSSQGDSTTAINTPLLDAPRSNVVVTVPSIYQVPGGTESIYRLYAESTSQTYQLEFILTDQELSVDVINESDIEINALIVQARPGGRLI